MSIRFVRLFAVAGLVYTPLASQAWADGPEPGDAFVNFNFSGPTEITEGTTATFTLDLSINDNDGTDYLHRSGFTFSSGNGLAYDFYTTEGVTSQNGIRLTATYTQDGTFSPRFGGTARIHDYTYGFSSHEDDNYYLTASRTLLVRNVAPTIASATLNGINGALTVDEGTTVSARMTSTDPGGDSHAFLISGLSAGVGGTSGTRTSGFLTLPEAADDGLFDVTFLVSDDDTSTSTTRALTVNNVAPNFTAAPGDATVDRAADPTFTFSAEATDPGVNDVLTFDWDLDGDGAFDDFAGASGETTFSEDGIYPLAVRVNDDDGGAAVSTFTLTVVPEPAGLSLLAFCGGLTLLRRGRRRA